MFKTAEKEQLKVPAHIDYLGDLRDFVVRIGKKHGFSDKQINAFKLSVDEAATNIIRHAYRESEDQGLITIRAVIKKNSLTLSLIDQGTYFDPKRVKNPDLKRYVDIGKKGGLGIFIMRKLMDEIDYRKTEEGNELRITKFRKTPEKGKILSAVSTIPSSIKVKYFFRTMAIITLIVAVGYLYFFLNSDDILISQFIDDARSTNIKIINRIRAIPPKTFFLLTDVPPIEEEYKDQIHEISIVDNSIGRIAYSSNLNEFDKSFFRPDFEQIEDRVFKYKLPNGIRVYEFESSMLIKDTGGTEIFKGTSHIYFSSENTLARIRSKRLNDFKLALFILGLSGAGVFLLIYVVMNPFRKLSDWVTNLGSEGIEDAMDIEASGEIGEIAKAFTDITHKFRESQKNLADQDRLKKEMQVAQEIQQTLLPMEFPDLDGYELAAYYEAAKEVGGDYYDFVEVDKDTLGIAVADVSGKGVPGSLVMAMIRQTLRTESRGLKDAAEVLARVNSFIVDDIKKGMFVTVFYLIIDSKTRSLNYASAGHNPMILYRASTKQTYYLNPKGFPIGVQLPEKDFFKKYIESDTIKLAKDDILLLYTDGITEAMNSNRELFGEERLQKVLYEYGHLDAESFVEKLKDSIYSFTEGTPQYDDITLVAIKEQSTLEEAELRRAKQAHQLISDGMSIREACERVNMTTYGYYNKYKKAFDEEGTDAFEIMDETISVEVKHTSIEEKTKVFDIIANHPEFGAGRIRDELNTEKYNFTELSEKKIYDELVRNRLNTRQLREAFVNKAAKSKRRLKPPGTPLMTLDGKIILKKPGEKLSTLGPLPVIEQPDEPAEKLKTWPENGPKDAPIIEETENLAEENHDITPDQPNSNLELDSLLVPSIDEYFSQDDSGKIEEPTKDAEQTEQVTDTLDSDQSEETHASIAEILGTSTQESLSDFDHEQTEAGQTKTEEPESTPLTDNFSFEELFEDGTIMSGQDLNFQDEGAPETEDDEAFVTASSIDELLTHETGETGETATEEAEVDAEDEEVDAEDEESEPKFEQAKSTPVDEKDVSFSDLIQALDDEIVYVSDTPNSNSGRILSQEKKDVESVEAKKEPEEDDKDSESRTKANKISDKEIKLINGIRFYKNKEYEKAIDEFQKVIATYPEYKEAHSILGNAYFRIRKYDEASNAYLKVREIDPNDVTAYENMGVIHANRGEYKEALREWKRVLELNPERTDIKNKIKKTLRMI
ncbi:MAG: tetratricopeptide repeat protein [Caldithrix sp.]|nr:MAG: tetratricopeptide repeat protein [Caldithrix sp.]